MEVASITYNVDDESEFLKKTDYDLFLESLDSVSKTLEEQSETINDELHNGGLNASALNFDGFAPLFDMSHSIDNNIKKAIGAINEFKKIIENDAIVHMTNEWGKHYQEAYNHYKELYDNDEKNNFETNSAEEYEPEVERIRKEYEKIAGEGTAEAALKINYDEYKTNQSFGDGKVESDGTREGNAKAIWNFLKSKGLSDAAAAAVLGNIQQESQFDPSAIEGTGEGHGLIQWSFDRRKALMAAAAAQGVDWRDLNFQLEYLWNEALNPESSYGKRLAAAGFYNNNISVADATYLFHQIVEGSNDSQNTILNNRIVPAQEWFNKFEGTQGATSITSALSNIGGDFSNLEFITESNNAAKTTGTVYKSANNNSNTIISGQITSEDLELDDIRGNLDVPYMSQNDPRWSGLGFGDGDIGTSGCSISSAAMALSAITGKTITPEDIRQSIMDNNGGNYKAFHVPDVGASHSVFPAIANYYNVKCEELSTSSNSIGNELREGNPVIVSVGAGPNHFTTNGHFIVLTGIDANGNVTVNDPNGAHDSYSANIYNLDQLCNSGEIQSARAFYT